MVKKYFIHFEITEPQSKLLDNYFSRSGEIKSEFFRKQIFNFFQSNSEIKDENEKLKQNSFETETLNTLFNENTDLKAQIASYKSKVSFIQDSFENCKTLLCKLIKYVDQDKILKSDKFGRNPLNPLETTILNQLLNQNKSPTFEARQIPANFFTFIYHQKQIPYV